MRFATRPRQIFYLKRIFLVCVVLGLCYCVQQIGLTVWFSNHNPRPLGVQKHLALQYNAGDKSNVYGKDRNVNGDDIVHKKVRMDFLAKNQSQSQTKKLQSGNNRPPDKKGNEKPRRQPKKQPKEESDEKLPPVVLATTNSVFFDFTKNWLESIRKLKHRPRNITIVTEDNATFYGLAEYPEVQRVRPKFMLPPNQTLVFDSPEYKAFVNKRPKYILDLLEKKHDVLFSDVDTVWLEDPFPYFTGDYDMFIQEDQPRPKLVLCAGFSYFRSTQNTVNFVNEWIMRLQTNKNKKPDQMVLNNMLREKSKRRNFKYKILDPKKFVSGRYYFDEEWQKNNADVKPVFLHNNWIVGHDIKVDRFKKLGYWYID